MDKGEMRQRVLLSLIVKLCIGQCSPQHFRRFWILMSAGWTMGSALGAWSLADGDPNAALLLSICLFMVVLSIVIVGMAIADIRSPRTVEGRVRRNQHLVVKGTGVDAHTTQFQRAERQGKYGRRITIENETGYRLILRAPPERWRDLAEGDLVTARVGMRLRWIFAIKILESTQNPSDAGTGKAEFHLDPGLELPGDVPPPWKA